jgi:hypothetical protein
VQAGIVEAAEQAVTSYARCVLRVDCRSLVALRRNRKKASQEVKSVGCRTAMVVCSKLHLRIDHVLAIGIRSTGR